MSPFDLQSLFAQAVRALDQGRLADAERLAGELQRAFPASAPVIDLMGVIALRQGRAAQAIVLLEKAWQLDAGSGTIALHLGMALSEAGRHQDAIAAFDHAITHDANPARAHSYRATALRLLGRPEEALAGYDAALALAPVMAEIWCLRANALLDLARPAEALASCERALALAPSHVGALVNRGNALKALDEIDAAIASFDLALAAEPQNADAHLGRGFAQLLAGHFAQGWPDYEYRHARRIQPTDIKGKTLLLRAEQGLGDTVQFCRYAQLAEAMGARAILAPQPQLLRLLRGLDPAIVLWDGAGPAPEHDLEVPLLSMPLLMGTDASSIPAATPYLKAEPALVEQWRARLGGGFKIGIAWQGAPGKSIDVGRSIPLRHFAPLALPDVRLISLQKGSGAEQLCGLPQIENLTGLDDGPDAFVDSAAVMISLDLIVTSDTAIAHLAGALGRPVWLALQLVPEWRWQTGRADSPWYPSMRLFRQDQAGDWDGVMMKIAARLREITQ